MTLQATKTKGQGQPSGARNAERCGRTTLSQGGPGSVLASRGREAKALRACIGRLWKPQVPPSQASPSECASTAAPGQAGEHPFSAGGAGKGGDGCAGGCWGCKGDLGLSDDQQTGCEDQSLTVRANVGSGAELSRAGTLGSGAGGQGSGSLQGASPTNGDRRQHWPGGKDCSAIATQNRSGTHLGTRLDLEVGQGPRGRRV